MGHTRTSRRSAGGSEGCARVALLVVAVWLGGCDGIRGEVLTPRPDATLSDLSGDDAQADAALDDVVRDDLADAMDAADAPTGCRIDRDCAGDPRAPVCEPASGRCVACRSEPDGCPAYLHCDPIQRLCVEGCRSDEGCVGSATDGGVADGGGVAARVCDTAVHQCVQCREDGHCPAGLLCAGQRCVPGCSATQACPAGGDCCESACVDRETDPSNCGACGAICALPNVADHGCAAGACTVARCTGGFGDCNATTTDGCETDTQTSPTNCGVCGRACALPHASASCVAGACTLASCAEGFADCDGDATNGCEADTRTTVAHCGACTRACPVPITATASCTSGVCGVVCYDGFVLLAGACVALSAPRPIAPLSTATVTSRRPNL